MLMNLESKISGGSQYDEEEVEKEYELVNIEIDVEVKKKPLKEKNSRFYDYDFGTNILVIDQKYSVKSFEKFFFGNEFTVHTEDSSILYTLSYIKEYDKDTLKKIYKHLTILRYFDFENISKLCDICFPQFPQSLNQLYCVTEGMDADLSRMINMVPYTPEHIKFFMFQILRALYQVHSAKIILGRLTPQDISIMQNCDLRLNYFHEARSFDDNILGQEEYIQENNYLSPETLIQNEISTQSDIWSAGIVFAELLLRRDLFKNASNIQENLQNIITFCGILSVEDKSFIKNTACLEYISNIKKITITDEQLFPAIDPICIDLLRKMLQFNPGKRLNALECLQHPYFQGYYFPFENEPQRTEFNWTQFEELKNLTKEETLQKLYQETLYYKYILY